MSEEGDSQLSSPHPGPRSHQPTLLLSSRVLTTHGFCTYPLLFPEMGPFTHLQQHALFSPISSPQTLPALQTQLLRSLFVLTSEFSPLQILTTYFSYFYLKQGFLLPAKAGLTGLDPFRFFTGTVGTL